MSKTLNEIVLGELEKDFDSANALLSRFKKPAYKGVTSEMVEQLEKTIENLTAVRDRIQKNIDIERSPKPIQFVSELLFDEGMEEDFYAPEFDSVMVYFGSQQHQKLIDFARMVKTHTFLRSIYCMIKPDVKLMLGQELATNDDWVSENFTYCDTIIDSIGQVSVKFSNKHNQPIATLNTFQLSDY